MFLDNQRRVHWRWKIFNFCCFMRWNNFRKDTVCLWVLRETFTKSSWDFCMINVDFLKGSIHVLPLSRNKRHKNFCASMLSHVGEKVRRCWKANWKRLNIYGSNVWFSFKHKRIKQMRKWKSNSFSQKAKCLYSMFMWQHKNSRVEELIQIFRVFFFFWYFVVFFMCLYLLAKNHSAFPLEDKPWVVLVRHMENLLLE